MNLTIENLSKAFVGESQARNRYTFYAKVAKKEGYESIMALFAKTAAQEEAHASQLFKLINQLQQQSGNSASVAIATDVDTTFGSTEANLQAAISGENFEQKTMYPGFADIADEEGLTDIASRLRAIAGAEMNHEMRFKAALASIKDGSIFKGSVDTQWECRKCGYKHTGAEPPERCPACNHKQSYFEKNEVK
jgi:rubrerythrin